MADALTDLAVYQKVDELMRVCRAAVREAQAESRRLGVPNVYQIGDRILYELPNGELVSQPPPSRRLSPPEQQRHLETLPEPPQPKS